MDTKTRKLLESYRAGELGDHRTLELFQALVKSGDAWKLGEHFRALAPKKR